MNKNATNSRRAKGNMDILCKTARGRAVRSGGAEGRNAGNSAAAERDAGNSAPAERGAGREIKSSDSRGRGAENSALRQGGAGDGGTENRGTRNRTLFWSCLCCLLLLFCFPGGHAQAARSFSVKEVVVDAEVLPDATLAVTEHITVDFSGQFNGFFVKIPQGNTPIQEIAVKENGKPYIFNPGDEYGPPGTWLLKTEGGQALIDWSIAAADEVRTFDVSYRVPGAVKMHKDVAELYRKFIGEANGNKISAVRVNLRLPAGAGQYKQGAEIRIWGHGPLTGEVNFSGPESIVWSAKNLPPYTFLEGRVVMPCALFPQAPAEVRTGQEALGKILAEEKGWAAQANRERLLAKAEYLGAAAVVALTLAVLYLLWRRFGRSHTAIFTGDYYRELPGNYSPAELSVLWNFKKMKARDIMAAILDLARRRFLYLQEETVSERRFIGSKTVATYALHFLPAPAAATFRNPEEAVLKPHEGELIAFLQNVIGGGRAAIYLTEIEQYAQKNGVSFYGFWKNWTGGIIARGEQYGFFEHSGRLPALSALAGVGLIILGSVLASQTGTVIGFMLAMAGLLFLFIPGRFKRRSISGQEDYVRWGAFKRFLLHFSEMQRHEIPSLVIWEHYLVYAVTLGVAKEVIQQLELVFPNMQDGDYRFGSGWMAYGAYHRFGQLNSSFTGIGNALERSLQTAQKAVSKKSSGSGGGGGFSGGGGGGGGGSSYGAR